MPDSDSPDKPRLRCCTFCGRDTRRRSGICTHCTRGTHLHDKAVLLWDYWNPIGPDRNDDVTAEVEAAMRDAMS